MTFFSDFKSKVKTVLSIEQECIKLFDFKSGNTSVTYYLVLFYLLFYGQEFVELVILEIWTKL